MQDTRKSPKIVRCAMQMQGSEEFGEVREACGIDARRSIRLFADHLASRLEVVRHFVVELRASLTTQWLCKPRAASIQSCCSPAAVAVSASLRAEACLRLRCRHCYQLITQARHK